MGPDRGLPSVTKRDRRCAPGGDAHLNVREVNRVFVVREAITHYRVLDEDGLVADVELLIETGRRHQIRMATGKLGCLIVGDALHAQPLTLGRVALHAFALEFLHPESEDPVRFEAPVPFVT